jgi:hypothetical protein
MNPQEHLRRCFVIGPMKNIARLRSLADDIIAPLLQERGFKIITPDEGAIGSIMDQVLLNLEQADLLVADLTGNNPNVMYELGIYHSFGKPSLVLKDRHVAVDTEPTPFDIAAYRYLDLNFADVAAARRTLQPHLEQILNALGERDWFPNPVTGFYNSPVAEIPTAVGLFKNYDKNFLQLIVPKVFLKLESGKGYELDLKAENDKGKMVSLRADERNRLRFELLIPANMHMCQHDYLRDLKQSGLLNLRAAKLIRKTREFNLHLRYEPDGTPVLVDVPTVLATLYESIQHRRGLKETQINNREWQVLESQELERFANKCERFVQQLENRFPSVRQRIKVVWRWSSQ